MNQVLARGRKRDQPNMTDEQIIPVFIPPLALLLARAEKLKESPLTESEVVRIRDNAVCMMLPLSKAAHLAKARGFRDIVPENCWVEWHRLKTQVTGEGYLPRIILCLPGGQDFRQRVEPILAAANVEHEFRDHDERMLPIFEAMNIASADDEVYERISQHKTVLYALSDNFTAEEAGQVAFSFMQLGQQLLDAGGIALKCESSGIGHSISSWTELTRKASQSHLEIGSSVDHSYSFWSSLIAAYVQYPLADNHDYYTCGLHLLGQPDLIMSTELVEEIFDTRIEDCLTLFNVFAMYLLAECPAGTFAPGNTFRLDAESQRFTLNWEPCCGYDEDDYLFNPFGMWRFEAD